MSRLSVGDIVQDEDEGIGIIKGIYFDETSSESDNFRRPSLTRSNFVVYHKPFRCSLLQVGTFIHFQLVRTSITSIYKQVIYLENLYCQARALVLYKSKIFKQQKKLYLNLQKRTKADIML